MQLYYFVNETTPPKLAERSWNENGAMVCGASDEQLIEKGAKKWNNEYPTVDEGYYVEPIGYENGDVIKTLWSNPIKIDEVEENE